MIRNRSTLLRFVEFLRDEAQRLSQLKSARLEGDLSEAMLIKLRFGEKRRMLIESESAYFERISKILDATSARTRDSAKPQILPAWQRVTGRSQFGTSLFAMRELEGLTQANLAMNLTNAQQPMSQATIARWERGDADSPGRLFAISGSDRSEGSLDDVESEAVYRLDRMIAWAETCNYDLIGTFIKKSQHDARAIIPRLAVEVAGLKYFYRPDEWRLLFSDCLTRLCLLARADSATCYVRDDDEGRVKRVASVGLLYSESQKCPAHLSSSSLPHRLSNASKSRYIENLLQQPDPVDPKSPLISDEDERQFIENEAIESSFCIPFRYYDDLEGRLQQGTVFLNYSKHSDVYPRQGTRLVDEFLESFDQFGDILAFVLGRNSLLRLEPPEQDSTQLQSSPIQEPASMRRERFFRSRLSALSDRLGIDDLKITLHEYVADRDQLIVVSAYPFRPDSPICIDRTKATSLQEMVAEEQHGIVALAHSTAKTTFVDLNSDDLRRLYVKLPQNAPLSADIRYELAVPLIAPCDGVGSHGSDGSQRAVVGVLNLEWPMQTPEVNQTEIKQVAEHEAQILAVFCLRSSAASDKSSGGA